MPITQSVYQVLFEQAQVSDIIADLMGRSPKMEAVV
jgi:glycerol-3-phosphate dehydrogenase